MKLIITVVKPYKIEDVKASLAEVGIDGMTVSEVNGFGGQKEHAEIYRGSEYNRDFLPRVKLEIAVPDDLAEKAIKAIVRAAKTGKIGDGKVFMLPLDGAVRIRTNERGEGAI